MPMPSAAPAAPAGATASAPAAPATPAAPAPAAGSTTGGMFDHLAYKEPDRPQDPQMDPPMREMGQVAPEATAQETKPEAAATETTETTETTPKGPEGAAAEPGKLFAKRFKTVPDLEVAYERSSQEGRRLAAVVKEREVQVEQLNSKLKGLEAKLSAGPELKELTQAEMDAMTPGQIAQHYAKLEAQKVRQEQAERERVATEKATKQASEEREAYISSKAEKMAKDTVRFPDYGALQPLMEEILDFEPGMAGHVYTPEILYFAAKGWKAAQAEAEGKKAGDESTAKAKAEAAAKAAAVGGTGPAGAEKTPAGGTQIDPNSDEAHNMRLLRGGRPAPVFRI